MLGKSNLNVLLLKVGMGQIQQDQIGRHCVVLVLLVGQHIIFDCLHAFATNRIIASSLRLLRPDFCGCGHGGNEVSKNGRNNITLSVECWIPAMLSHDTRRKSFGHISSRVLVENMVTSKSKKMAEA